MSPEQYNQVLEAAKQHRDRLKPRIFGVAVNQADDPPRWRASRADGAVCALGAFLEGKVATSPVPRYAAAELLGTWENFVSAFTYGFDDVKDLESNSLVGFGLEACAWYKAGQRMAAELGVG